MKDFWHAFTTPFMALAPMEDVTDTVFREVIMSVSEPDRLHVVFTEFTSTDGLCDHRGRTKVMERLHVNESERQMLQAKNIRLVAQLWGSKPEKFRESARLISELGCFDGIDINMGCPVKKVVKGKSCAALIKYPALAKEIVWATKDATPLPVSVKTRIGFHEAATEAWIGHLLESKPAAITVHGRTQKMLSTGLADWTEIAKAVHLRNATGTPTVMIGNGDVTGCPDAFDKVIQSGVNGVMVGTGIFKNPWMFGSGAGETGLDARFQLLQKHIELFRDTWADKKNYNILKRFYKIYLNGFRGAAECQEEMMLTQGYDDALKTLQNIRKTMPEFALA